jgi:glycerophosphoryl diester phosphodiesterase
VASACKDDAIQLGPRPFYLVQGMDEGKLKDRLMKCENGPFYRSFFSIGHRGAALQFPEHTKEAYQAGARMGAGIVECDTTFTKDGALVCRHDECDLHTTTNIVATPLNTKCTVPWSGPSSNPKCCTSDLTLSEFKSLKARWTQAIPTRQPPQTISVERRAGAQISTPGAAPLMTLRESIELNERNGVKHTPELKSGNPNRIRAVFGSQSQFAQRLIDEFKAAGIDPRDVWAQSFNRDDILYWIQKEPKFGKQAVYLDSIDPTVTPEIPRLALDELRQLKKQGVQIIAPPIFALLSLNAKDEIVPSQYALDIKAQGFDIITWTFERADLRRGAAFAGFYYLFDPQGKAVKKDSDMYKALDVLARQVGVLGIFSDWPATVTYYANCMGLK